MSVKTRKQTVNIKETIIEKMERRGLIESGEDWESSIFDYSQETLTPDEAREIAEWVRTEADDAWGYDERHEIIADLIDEVADEAEALPEFNG